MSVPRGAQTPSRTPEIPARHASPSIPFLRLPGAAVDLPASLPPLTESPSPTSERRLSFRSRLKNRLSPRLQALSRWKKEKRLLAYPLFDIGPDLLHHLCLFLSSNRVIALAVNRIDASLISKGRLSCSCAVDVSILSPGTEKGLAVEQALGT
ncbi:MAG: hypothetical protein MHM6MM_008592 [Cercozoa sp. M6MM]